MPADLAVASQFKDSQVWHGIPINQVGRYFDQMLKQTGIEGLEVEFHLLEGDSRDSTYVALQQMAELYPNVKLLKMDVGGPEIASIVSEDRFKTLTTIGNATLRSACDSGAKNVLWVESDLIIPPYLIQRLLAWTREPFWEQTLAIAPIPTINLGGHKCLYDTWAFEGINGERWPNHHWHSLLENGGQALRPMRAVGSCAILNGDALRTHNLDFRDRCFPALCAAGRAVGLDVYCDVSLEIQHPDRLVASRMV